ncbi:hypothetical protein GOB57_09185 [Sinorhizobium meliloti]|nr:hypothetical protein [Sinorhizobium meliloti]
MEGYSAEGAPYEIEVRKVRNRFYRPKLSIRYDEYRPLDDGSDRLAAGSLGTLVPTFHFGNGDGQNAYPDRLDQTIRFIGRPQRDRRVITSHAREDVLANIREAARDLVVVDGQVWERCGEPKLCVDLFWSPPSVSVVFEGPEARSPSGIACLFPMDQGDPMRAMLEEASSDPRLLVGKQEKRPRVIEDRMPWTTADVLIPRVTYVDPGLLADPRKEIVAAARNALRDILAAPLERYTRSLILAWVDFRDAVETAEQNAAHSNIELVLDTWQIANETVLREPSPRNGVMREAPAERLRSRYELEAYRDRWQLATNVPAAKLAQRQHHQPG